MLDTVLIVLLIIAVVVIVAGVIRIMIKSPDSFGDFIMQLLWLDILTDLIGLFFELLGEILSGLGD